MSIDPVTMSVVGQSLSAIAEEMNRNLIRSAYSTIVREARDASTALMTPSGSFVAQGERTIPILLNAFPPLMASFAAQGLIRDIEPGQALITNDPYAGGQHLDDVVLVIPVFDGSGVLGWSASLAHQLDLGAGSPGINPKAREVFEEGLRIPPTRIQLATDLGSDGWLTAMLRANIRMPDLTLGDLRAQIAAVRTGERRLLELAERYGRDTVLNSMNALLVYAETMMRTGIAAVPDGRYEAEEWMDDDGYDSGPLRIAVTIEVSGDSADVDVTGTDAQTKGPVNAPLASTISTVHTALKYLLLPENVPPNEGCTRPITITAPEGCLLNPRYPAAVSARMNPVFKLFDAMLVALAPALADRVIAPSFSAVSAVALSQRDAQGQRLYREALGGGYGAGEGYHGGDGLAVTLTNTANTPVEFTESTNPYFFVEEYALRRGSGGTGQFRGGMGIAKTYRVLGDDVLFAAYSDRHHSGPRGLSGGGAGERAVFQLEHGDQEVELPSKVIAPVARGDRIRVLTAGGGGYGPAPEEDQ